MTEGRGHFAVKLGAAAMVIATVIAYAPSLNGTFLWDDGLFTYNSTVIRDNLSPLLYWKGKDTPDYYPVLSTFFWMQWQVFERNAPGYRAVNLALHIISCLLLWRVLIRLRLGEPAAWFGAMLFALHPVNVATAAWIAEQKNTLAMVFFLGSVLAYLRFDDGGGRKAYAWALGLFALSILSKASVVILPACLAVLVVYRHGAIRKRDVVALLPMFALAAVGAVVAIYFQHNRAIVPHGPPVRPEGIPSRIAATGWMIWFYLRQALLPIDLMMIYPRWKVDGTSAVAYLPLVGVIAAAGVLWKVNRAWLTPLAWFVIALLPVLGLIDMSYHALSLVADHWVYIALPAVTATVAAIVVHGIRHPAAKLAIMAAMCVALGVLTFQHSAVYRHTRALWADNVKRNPDAWLAHNDLGYAMVIANPEQAKVHFRKAIELQPVYAKPYSNLAVLMAREDRLDEAIELFRKAASLAPRDVPIHRDLGRALLQRGDMDEALAALRTAMQLDPGYGDVRYWYGIALNRAGEYAKALPLLEAEAAAKPVDPVLQFEYGKALLESGQRERAVMQLRRTRDIAARLRNTDIVMQVDALLQ